jgi:predicted dehydrogenase
MKQTSQKSKKIRYAVVGLGYIAQGAVLPAFKHAANSSLTALVSDDPKKLKTLSRRYKVPLTYSYEEYEQCLRSGEIDAVFIALPNSLHRDYTVRAAEAGIHVLCEKPMAVTEAECREMIRAAERNRVKLMVAYRLHFEAANLDAVRAVQSGKIGDPRFFVSTFGQQVKKGDIRLDPKLGGGSIYDMGVYCLNAARYLFREEPTEVSAFSAHPEDPRFKGIDEMTGALLRFPKDRIAMILSSLGSGDTSYARIVGTKGDVVLEPAFDYSIGLQSRTTVGTRKTQRSFPKRDQFAAELLYFSNCVLKNQTPEPSGYEGLADVRVIEAIYRSAQTHRPVSLGRFDRQRRPTAKQEIRRPPVGQMPELVHASPPSGN